MEEEGGTTTSANPFCKHFWNEREMRSKRDRKDRKEKKRKGKKRKKKKRKEKKTRRKKERKEKRETCALHDFVVPNNNNPSFLPTKRDNLIFKEGGVSHKKGAVSKGQQWNLGQASRQTNKKKKQEETKNKGRERKKKRKGVPGF